MSYQSDIKSAVTASTAVTALIGSRFAWDIIDPSFVAPYIVAQTISNQASGDLSGYRDTSFPLIQVTCWSTSKAQAIEIMRLFAVDIEGVELAGSSGTSLNFAGEQSTYDSETKLYGEIREFRASISTK